MAGASCGAIWACRGEYYVLDRRVEGSLNTLIYPVPGPNDPGLGIHLTPTVDGNILIGPSAEYIPDEDREDYRSTASVMSALRREGVRLMPGLAAGDFIRSFSGNRPKQTPPEVGGNADFTIDGVSVPGFINLTGIESPGLTSSSAIAEEVRELVGRRIPLNPAQNFKSERPGFARRFSQLPIDARIALVRAAPEYGEIFCRCEGITKHEVREAIENSLGARRLMSIKYRARATMGRCQGGFCLQRIVRMLRDEYGYSAEDFIMRGADSRMFAGHTHDIKAGLKRS
jgi:glycerol-3-phosphate dehydrogenase